MQWFFPFMLTEASKLFSGFLIQMILSYKNPNNPAFTLKYVSKIMHVQVFLFLSNFYTSH